MKYIGIDYGTKKTGIAISDPLGSVAFPREVLATDSLLPRVVADIIKNEEVNTIVVGESLNLSGGLNSVADDAREFIRKLRDELGVEILVHYEDERFTTRQARALPNEGKARGDIANKGRTTTRLQPKADTQAAAIILQTFLDKQQKAV